MNDLRAAYSAERDRGRFRVGRRIRGIRRSTSQRPETCAVAAPAPNALEVADYAGAAARDAADKDLAVVGPRMAAAIAQRRAFAFRADLERSPCALEHVTAITADGKHVNLHRLHKAKS